MSANRRSFLILTALAGFSACGCSALHAAPITNATANSNPNIEKVNFYSDSYKPTEEEAREEKSRKPVQVPESVRQEAGSWSEPVDAQIGTPYRKAGSNWSSGYHTGTDFAVSTGTPIKAIGAGVVIAAGWGGSYGNQVVIQHPSGRFSQYAHFSKLKVAAGAHVKTGQIIGLSGATGNVTGPHLHFEVRTGPGYGSDIDPIAFLRTKNVKL